MGRSWWHCGGCSNEICVQWCPIPGNNVIRPRELGIQQTIESLMLLNKMITLRGHRHIGSFILFHQLNSQGQHILFVRSVTLKLDTQPV
jgi:hypothetical protein